MERLGPLWPAVNAPTSHYTLTSHLEDRGERLVCVRDLMDDFNSTRLRQRHSSALVVGGPRGRGDEAPSLTEDK